MSHEWIPRAVIEKNPRLTLALAATVPLLIEQDALDRVLETRIMNITDTEDK